MRLHLDPFWGVRSQALLGAVAVGLVFETARIWFGRRAAWIAAGLAATTGVFAFYESVFLQAALDPFLTALALYLVTRAAANVAPTAPATPITRWVAAGFAVGLLALNRPNALLYAAALVVLVAVSGLVAAFASRSSSGAVTSAAAGITAHLRQPAAVALGVMLALAPVTLGNLLASGELVLISSYGGLNFYIGNHAEADGAYRIVPGVTPSIDGQARDTREVAETALGRDLSPGEVSRYFYGRAFAWIAEAPVGALKLLGRKVAYLFNATYLTLNYSYAYYSRDEPTLLRALAVGPWLLIPLGLLGLAIPWWGRLSRDRPRSGYVAWSAFVPIYAFSVAIFFVSERYRLPLLVPLAVGAGAAADGLWRLARTTRGRVGAGDGTRAPARALAIPVIGLVLLSMGANLDLGLDDGRSHERTEMVVANLDAGRDDEAEDLIELAAGGHPQPGVLHFRAARAYLERGTSQAYGSAVRHLRAALRHDPGQAELLSSLTEALVGVGDREGAVGALRKLAGVLDAGGVLEVAMLVLDAGALAVQLDAADVAAELFEAGVRAAPHDAVLHEKLGLALAVDGRATEAIGSLEEAARLAPDNARTRLNLAVLYAQEGRLDAARKAAYEALRIRPDYPAARELLGVLDAAR